MSRSHSLLARQATPDLRQDYKGQVGAEEGLSFLKREALDVSSAWFRKWTPDAKA